MKNLYENNLVVVAMSCAEIEGLRHRVTKAEKENEILLFNSDIDAKQLGIYKTKLDAHSHSYAMNASVQ